MDGLARRSFASIIVLAFVLAMIAAVISQVWQTAIDLVPLALLLDSFPALCAIVVTVIIGRELRHERITGRRWIIGLYVIFSGLVIGMLGIGHLVAVVNAAFRRVQAGAFLYDFRFYSLILFGVLLLICGATLAYTGAELARGIRNAWRICAYFMVAVAFLNLPLVTIQTPAIFFSALAIIGTCALYLSRDHFSVPVVQGPVHPDR